jgi:tetratricopeptide (TPR) repeat protein
LTSCASSGRRAEDFLQKARLRAKEGKTNEAILDYRRVIQYQPGSLTAHLELASVYLADQEYLSAFKELQTVLSLHPGDRKARTQIAAIMLRQGGFAEAKAESQKLLSEQVDDPAAMFVLAESALGLRDFALARTTSARMLQLDPKDSHGWYILGIVDLADGKPQESEENLRKAIENDPTWVDPIGTLAALLLQQKDSGQAEEVIRQALMANPEGIRAHYVLATFLISQGRNAEAEVVVQKIKSLGEGNSRDRGALARYYLLTRKLEAAKKEFSEILRRHPDDGFNRRQLANMEIGANDFAGAEELLNDGLKIKPSDPDMLLLRGQLRVAQGQLNDGIRDLQRVSALHRGWAEPQYFLGLAQLRAGQPYLAENAFNSALQLSPDLLDARLALAGIALERGQAHRARHDLEEVLKGKPTAVEPYVLHAVALAGDGEHVAAVEALLRLINEFPQPRARGVVYRTLAWVELNQGSFEEAHSFAKRAVEADPMSLDALSLLGMSRLQANHVDEGLAEVESRVQVNPQWAGGYEALGRLYLRARRFADAERSFNKALQLDPNMVTARLDLSAAEAGQNKVDQAIDTLVKLTQSHPRVSQAYQGLGRMCETKKDWVGAATNYKKALELSADDFVTKNNLAWVLAEHGGDIDFALKLAQEAKEAQPDNPAVSDTLGWILVKKQSYGSAIEQLRQAAEKSPDKASYQYHLGVAYLNAAQNSKARQAFEAALRLQQDFPGAREAIRNLQSREM